MLLAVFAWGKPAPGGETVVFWAGVPVVGRVLGALACRCVEHPAERLLRGLVVVAGRAAVDGSAQRSRAGA
ncbi:hypothetical protein ACWD3Z_14840 [Streptomyces sp. NPDC002740]